MLDKHGGSADELVEALGLPAGHAVEVYKPVRARLERERAERGSDSATWSLRIALVLVAARSGSG